MPDCKQNTLDHGKVAADTAFLLRSRRNLRWIASDGGGGGGGGRNRRAAIPECSRADLLLLFFFPRVLITRRPSSPPSEGSALQPSMEKKEQLDKAAVDPSSFLLSLPAVLSLVAVASSGV